MKTEIYRAASRGHANHGWLDSHHTFSFAGYYDPNRIQFGALRVLNDDIVQGGYGFSTHPHDNMEIISIPLEGDLEHKDSMGNTHVIRENDIQAMSAGTGVSHSEYNRNKDKLTNFLQIWVFPNQRNVEPRYSQITLEPSDRKNKLQQILSPNADDEGVWIHQNAWFHRGDLESDTELRYRVKSPGNGVFTFILDGELTVAGEKLNKRDGLGIWDTDDFSIRAHENAEILIMEVPLS